MLVVDDDLLLAQTLKLVITDFARFEVGVEIAIEIATSGREAARLLEADDAFDVVVCNLSMPGVDGIAVYEGLVARGSPLAGRFVLVTGGAFTPAAAATVARHGMPCLQKPFDSARLAAALKPYFV